MSQYTITVITETPNDAEIFDRMVEDHGSLNNTLSRIGGGYYWGYETEHGDDMIDTITMIKRVIANYGDWVDLDYRIEVEND